MRIKFLSIIASFFMVSCVITSCLDDDTNIEYSPDATIHAFALDTIGYGKTYKFTIDQIKGEIYNEDSIPVHADTIIDRILIKTLTTASGIVTMRNKADTKDSIININDSIDFRPYVNQKGNLKIKIWAPDMTEAHTKEYKIGIRQHMHAPDSLRWTYIGALNNEIDGPQKSIVFNNKIYTYSVIGGKLKVYQSPIDNISWSGSETDQTSMPTSIVAFKGKLYATFAENNNQGYTSSDGVVWSPSSLSNVELFLAPILTPNKERISFLKKGNDKYTFATSTNGEHEDYPQYEVRKEFLENEARKKFPSRIGSYVNHVNRNGTPGALLTGNSDEYFTINDGKNDVAITVAWGYSEDNIKVNKLTEDGTPVLDDQNKPVPEYITITRWVELPAGSSLSYCPKLDNPTIIYYNSQFYLFGNGFNSFYVSPSGRDWKKTTQKFTFPNQDWSKPNTGYNPENFPEFRGRINYSMVVDENKDYLVFMFAKGTNVHWGDESSSTYSYDSEVWRGRLNSLWFQNDPKKQY